MKSVLRLIPGLICAIALFVPSAADQKPLAGPQTEKRFPPLKVPTGFQATLFACDPLIEYPSVIAVGPRNGTLFVAIDYVTGLGVEIVRRDEIRLIEDTDGDGYADKATVYAGKFNSLQGLAYHEGTVYAMHAPFLTALRDTNGDGVADERRDLLAGIGLPPEKNPNRLHCANGAIMGHDGWLYLAMGDYGCDIQRPEGDRLVHHGGAILRCRGDGRDLHVFATGLRNIYDVALDAELNVFVRDNENDGGDYKIRVCHSFFGADHGYPYHYYERPAEALPPLADLGLGSSAGGVCYLEQQFPPEYRGNLFFCEWGRSVVRYPLARAGSGFGPVKEHDFAAGADNDPYGFKPTDVVVQRDGSLMVSDWCDGQRPKRGRGRIYCIRVDSPRPSGEDRGSRDRGEGFKPPKDSLARLDAESYHERCAAQAELERRGRDGAAAVSQALATGKVGERGRLHAVWVLAHVHEANAVEDLFRLAKNDPSPNVQAQAVRALADLSDPVLVRHRLDATGGDAALAARLAELAKGREPRVVLEIVVALGRLRWAEAPGWLHKNLTKPDAALGHAATQALRRCPDRAAVLKLLDLPSAEPVRILALRAVAEQADATTVDGLIARLSDPDPARRFEYADALTRVHHQPGPWTYWGFRPPPRPPNTAAWQRTEAIAAALGRLLIDPERGLRLSVLRRLQREKIPASPTALVDWLNDERQPDRVAVLLESLREQPASGLRGSLRAVVSTREHSVANRLTALSLYAGGLDSATEGQLLELAGMLEDGPVLAEVLRQCGKRPKLAVQPLLQRQLGSQSAEVRAAAIEALAERRAPEIQAPVLKLLDDSAPIVRQAAATAAGKLGVRAALETLLQRARDSDPGVRRESLEALRLFQEPRVVPLAVAALADRQTELKALECLALLGGPEQAAALTELARRNPSAEVLTRVLRALTGWASKAEESKRRELERAVAEVQGFSGALLRWQASGPRPAPEAAKIVEQSSTASSAPPVWKTLFAGDSEGRVNLGAGKDVADDSLWFACTDVVMAEPTKVQLLASSNGTFRVWLNGRSIHQRSQASAFRAQTDRFTAQLDKGPNRLLVQVSRARGEKNAVEFELRFRRSAGPEHERLTQAALGRRGDPARGLKLFLDVEKSLCLKCHRLGDQGERIGPELTGVGSRFARIHIIESILEPSRAVAQSFETLVLELTNGKVLSGIKIADTDKTLTLADNQGQKHEVKKSDIESQRTQPASTMPDGLEKRLTEEEFIDLIAFLVSQKETRAR